MNKHKRTPVHVAFSLTEPSTVTMKSMTVEVTPAQAFFLLFWGAQRKRRKNAVPPYSWFTSRRST